MISILIIVLASAIFLHQKKQTQFFIFSLAAILPFTFGDIKSFPNVLVIEWLAPIFFLVLFHKLITLNSTPTKEFSINYDGVRIFFLALIILVIWVVISFVKYEILKIDLTVPSNFGAKRFYYRVIIDILVLMNTIFFIYLYFEEINFQKWFKLLIFLSIILGIIRIISFFLQIEIPFLTGAFAYNPRASSVFGGVAYRIGGLSIITEIGLASLFALNLYKSKINPLLYLFFIFFVFISGGRTLLLGFFTAIFTFSFFFYKKHLLYISIFLIVSLILIFIFAPQEILIGQLNRLTAFSGGIKQQSNVRYISYILHFQNFMEHPLFGKGVVPYTGFILSPSERMTEFIRSNLLSGGHGSYISILGTFGIGGIFYLLVMTLGGIMLSYKEIKWNFNFNDDFAAISIFTFTVLIIKSIYYLTAFNGINDISLFYFVGLIMSIRILENYK